MGLIGAAFIAVGAFVGWLLAGQWSDDVGNLFSDSLTNDTVVTVLSYAIIIGGAVVVASIVKKITLPLLNIFTLGLTAMVDRLGGALMGLVIGLALAAALVIAMARLTYDFEFEETLTGSIPEQVPGEVTQLVSEGLAKVTDARESLETALTESQLVATVIDITTALPANALGFVPADFKTALEILEDKIE